MTAPERFSSADRLAALGDRCLCGHSRQQHFEPFGSWDAQMGDSFGRCSAVLVGPEPPASMADWKWCACRGFEIGPPAP